MNDRDLVRLHWPAALRPAFDALFGLDDAMADVVLKARDPALAMIKLAWWREQLQALDVTPPPAEPRLRAVGRELLPRNIRGEQLASLEDGWIGVIHEDAAAAANRGELLFSLAQQLLGLPAHDLSGAGGAWALVDLARRTGEQRWLGFAGVVRMTAPRPVRPITALAALAARDLSQGWPAEAEGTPGRSWTLLRHRLTGRF